MAQEAPDKFEFSSEGGSTYKMSKPWEGVYSRLNRTYTDTTDVDRTNFIHD